MNNASPSSPHGVVPAAPVRLGERSLLSLSEAAAYARVTPAALAEIPVAVQDPWKPGGSLVERRAVDAWWRSQVLARSTH